jgi:hypothetical protein
MVEFASIIIQKRSAVTISVLLLTILLLSPILQAHHTSIAAQIQATHAAESTRTTYDSANAVSNALSSIGNDVGDGMRNLRSNTLSDLIVGAAVITRFDEDVTHDTDKATADALHAVSDCVGLTARAIVSSFSITVKIIGDVSSLTMHSLSNTSGFVAGLTHISTLIRPPDHTPAPTITQMRAQEATIIQSGTINVPTLPSTVSSGTGGACDDGAGNGGYPMSWCDAPMDSIVTLSFNNDPINRECTSYADWYFTSVEGHTNFQAWGNAKYWATTSNYPTYSSPTVGAIAVETAGAYGHVAIVQALSGQTYAGQVVPTGYILVSEMNYDWDGHFRYSYSPLSKFTSYIYP